MIALNRETCPNPTALATNYKHADNKKALERSSSGKCMYCESKVTDISFGDVEHIKPKSVYTTLTYDWGNLGYSCQICNNNKREAYDEACPFINPYEENPGDHLVAAGWYIFAKQGSERGELTVNTIDLNRAGLLESRKEKLEQLVQSIDACFRTQDDTLKALLLERLKSQGDSDKEYSFVLKNHLDAQLS